jgi:ABC-type branched-subunit amino acid transport system ATPase component
VLAPQGRDIFPNLFVRDELRVGGAKEPGADSPVIQEVLQEFPRLKLFSSASVARCLAAKCNCWRSLDVFAASRSCCWTSRPRASQPSIIEEIIETLEGLKYGAGLVVLVELNLDFLGAHFGRP